ncbi:MAG: hypothetical protein HC903_25245 [Methylacidiphilales bacterium]|nr:hypothetical protein [Candidatus Methylacidiphilales bacterium]NJR17025.1 hypothetical protein [Calothrix sp. CSU_2_0]
MNFHLDDFGITEKSQKTEGIQYIFALRHLRVFQKINNPKLVIAIATL